MSMEKSKLKKYAQYARRNLIEQVSNKIKIVLAEDSVARRESADAVKKLEDEIKAHDKEQMPKVWLNLPVPLKYSAQL